MIQDLPKLEGQLLVANPLNPMDELNHSVILITEQTQHQVCGLQLNFPTKSIRLEQVFLQSGIWWEGDAPVYFGGSKTQKKIHMVHTLDWYSSGTKIINNQIGVTNDVSVLMAIADGVGPEKYRACAGHWVWEESDPLDKQLDSRSDSLHKWEIAPLSERLIFGYDQLTQWHKAMEASAADQAAKWTVNLFQD